MSPVHFSTVKSLFKIVAIEARHSKFGVRRHRQKDSSDVVAASVLEQGVNTFKAKGVPRRFPSPSKASQQSTPLYRVAQIHAPCARASPLRKLFMSFGTFALLRSSNNSRRPRGVAKQRIFRVPRKAQTNRRHRLQCPRGSLRSPRATILSMTVLGRAARNHHRWHNRRLTTTATHIRWCHGS